MKAIGTASLTQRWTVRRFRPQQEWRRGKVGSVSPSTCDIYDLRENPEAIAHKCGGVPLGAVASPAVRVGRALADVVARLQPVRRRRGQLGNYRFPGSKTFLREPNPPTSVN